MTSRPGRIVAVAAAAALGVALFPPPGLATRAPSARELTALAAAYVRTYDGQLPAVVGEESHEQSLHERTAGRPARDESRHLRSTVAWVHLPRLSDTVAVRDVFEIDGHRIDGGPGLESLLRAPAATLENNVRDLLNRSAAHNLAPGSRNINFPTFPLVYLRQAHVDRSRWRLPRGGPATILSFQERGRPAIVRSESGSHLRARGRFWLDAGSGQVERAEVHLKGERVTYRLHVRFAHDERLALWLPSRMEDVYERAWGFSYLRVTGTATYSNYRRFETEGRIVPPAR